nr:MAG TPA: hypothetical protein [Caudoviricetes sp.]
MFVPSILSSHAFPVRNNSEIRTRALIFVYYVHFLT